MSYLFVTIPDCLKGLLYFLQTHRASMLQYTGDEKHCKHNFSGPFLLLFLLLFQSGP